MKTYKSADFNGISNIEFQGAGSARLGKADGDLTFDYGTQSHTVSGEFFVDKQGYLHHDFCPDGVTEDITILVMVDDNA